MKIKRQTDPHDLVIEQLDRELYLVIGPELPMRVVDEPGCTEILTIVAESAAGMILNQVLRPCGRYLSDLQPETLRRLQVHLAH